VTATAHDILTGLDGSDSVHAHGRADDLHRVLGLLGDRAARRRAQAYLGSAIMHRGTPSPVTARVADALAACLPCPDAVDAREAILDFLTDVAWSVTLHGVADRSRADPAEAQRMVAAVIASGSDHPLDVLYGDPRYPVLGRVFDQILDSRMTWARAAVPLVGDPDLAVAYAAARLIPLADPRR
jgi:hypothetical protein